MSDYLLERVTTIQETNQKKMAIAEAKSRKAAASLFHQTKKKPKSSQEKQKCASQSKKLYAPKKPEVQKQVIQKQIVESSTSSEDELLNQAVDLTNVYAEELRPLLIMEEQTRSVYKNLMLSLKLIHGSLENSMASGKAFSSKKREL